MKKLTILLLVSLVGFSCVKEDQAYTTFTGDVIYTYLQKDTAYSEFVKYVDKAGMKGMLSAYGSYACLAPNNTAFRKLYRTLGSSKFNFDSLRQGQVDTIARTHIILNKFLTPDQQDGVLPSLNMDGRVIEIKFTTNPQTDKLMIMLNDSSQIISKDNEVYNGVVHGINKVLTSSNALLPTLLANNPELSIFSKALEMTHLSDSISQIEDQNYHPTKKFLDEYNKFEITNPTHRKFGYTVFAETDGVFKTYGINNLSDLIATAKKLYPSDPIYDNDYTNRNNSLNQFIAYHLVNKAIYYNKFFYIRNTAKNFTPDEFIETMLPNRIMKASLINKEVVLNNNSDYGVIVPVNASKATINGLYHKIDKMLVYSVGVERMLQTTRIRFDVSSLFPELTNNNCRGSVGSTPSNGTGDRYGFESGYLSGISITKDTRLIYMSGVEGAWRAFQADEFHGLDQFDFTIRLLPVPPGTYEFRIGYSTGGIRSICQIYFDNKPVGIPLDLEISAEKPKIGYILDTQTGDNGYENDKMMRNRGYMKFPNTIVMGGPTNVRDVKEALRRIVGTFTFDDYKPHTIRFKKVDQRVNSQGMTDFFEYVPKSISNPASGEPEGRE